MSTWIPTKCSSHEILVLMANLIEFINSKFVSLHSYLNYLPKNFKGLTEVLSS